ncbi:MAG: glycosyltransferase family 39 protein [Elusimicrobia bacterium]|nr:glycosyltransferase family 39 protein [Elusimicrobiota bacterium]
MPKPLPDPEEAARRRGKRALAWALGGAVLFLAFQAWLLALYIRSETRPPRWDEAIHMEIALDYSRAISEGRWADMWNLPPKPGMPPFPPLYHLGLAAAYGSDNPLGNGLWLNWIYFAALILCLFGLVTEFSSPGIALAAALLIGASPAVQSLLCSQLIDLSVAALVAAAYWAYLRSDKFSRWRPSLAFGALFALGMMHKWSFFAYFLPAYYDAFLGITERRCRGKILAAAGIAAAGFAPWYLTHLPVLLPRLVQASADSAVPFWQGTALFTYLLQAFTDLGPLFWLAGWAGLCMPRHDEHRDKEMTVIAWVLSSYLFWALVPNRQMRFLLPGLLGLALAAVRAWPPQAIWALALIQCLGGANHMLGWTRGLELPLPFQATVFPSSPPESQDWKIADILSEAQRRAPQDRPVANLTLVANAPRFNGPNFTWTAKQLGLATVRIRGVNSRLSELSEFVVLKGAPLGPAGVIGGLPAAAALIQDESSWFSKAYRPVKGWDLPDGSEAVLYEQASPKKPPFREGDARFDFYEIGRVEARKIRLWVEKWSQADGMYQRAGLEAESIQLRGLEILHPKLEFEGLRLVSASSVGSPAWEEPRLLRLKRLKLRSAEITEEGLRVFLEKRLRGLKIDRLHIEDGVRASGAWKGVSLALALSLRREGDALTANVESARIGITPVPGWALGRWRSIRIPLSPTSETPFWIDLPGLTLSQGRLTIP